MELPKFLIADNSTLKEDLFIVHTEYPRFILNVSNDQVHWLEEFEKDVDTNFHIDFIYSMANIRAENYALQQMDWITTKIKAGRIVPALATTTAAIAGL